VDDYVNAETKLQEFYFFTYDKPFFHLIYI